VVRPYHPSLETTGISCAIRVAGVPEYVSEAARCHFVFDPGSRGHPRPRDSLAAQLSTSGCLELMSSGVENGAHERVSRQASCRPRTDYGCAGGSGKMAAPSWLWPQYHLLAQVWAKGGKANRIPTCRPLPRSDGNCCQKEPVLLGGDMPTQARKAPRCPYLGPH
jgi:hypothetical protein